MDKISIGDTFQYEHDELWTSGIQINKYGNAIEFHAETKRKAKERRNEVFFILKRLQKRKIQLLHTINTANEMMKKLSRLPGNSIRIGYWKTEKQFAEIRLIELNRLTEKLSEIPED